MSNPLKTLNPSQLRAECAQRLWRVMNPETSEALDAVLQPALASPEQQSWMSAAIYGCLRFYPRYQHQLYGLLKTPIKAKEGEIQALLILGLHQLSEMRIKSHAAINETVNACRVLQKDWAIKLVNGVLRNYQRQLEQQNVDHEFKSEKEKFAHPNWIIKRLKKDWPDHWQQILLANNQQAPMSLRINIQQVKRSQALEILENAGLAAAAHAFVESAIVLDDPCDVSKIPGFFDGVFSVQDVAAQQAATILIGEEDRNNPLNVLDACAAPGGKTGHLLERLSAESSLLALDISEKRIGLVHEMRTRLGFINRENFKIKVGDASDLNTWHKQEKFDRILLDAPCTATGVIRRHPDIKIRRSPKQVEDVVQIQKTILHTLWTVLKPGGRLLYATCSVFQDENSGQVLQFLNSHKDAKVLPLELADAIDTGYGSQIIPGSNQQDGFFYALLEKGTIK